MHVGLAGSSIKWLDSGDSAEDEDGWMDGVGVTEGKGESQIASQLEGLILRK